MVSGVAAVHCVACREPWPAVGDPRRLRSLSRQVPDANKGPYRHRMWAAVGRMTIEPRIGTGVQHLHHGAPNVVAGVGGPALDEVGGDRGHQLDARS